MKFKVVTLVVLALQLVSGNLECDGSAMNTGGFVDRPSEDKAALGEFPWVVALYKKDSANPHCAGSIIDDTTVLTTAFCVKLITNPSDLIIRAGLWDLNKTKVDAYQMQQRVAKHFTTHPQYISPDPIDNDIAVIHVNQPFRFTDHVSNICLYSGSQKVSTTGCFATGWGAETYETQHELSQMLKKVKMDHVDHDICEKQLRTALKKESFTLTDSFLCAGGNKNDLCAGDSGSPLVCPVAGEANKYVLTGLASYGVKCFTETPGVYTNILKYHDWIRDQTEM